MYNLKTHHNRAVVYNNNYKKTTAFTHVLDICLPHQKGFGPTEQSSDVSPLMLARNTFGEVHICLKQCVKAVGFYNCCQNV
jgi:hypothetical protein